jgi:hypothetical protein
MALAGAGFAAAVAASATAAAASCSAARRLGTGDATVTCWSGACSDARALAAASGAVAGRWTSLRASAGRALAPARPMFWRRMDIARAQ